MRTTSFYSHNIRISTAIGKPKMAKFPRFAIPNQVTGQLPIHSRSQKSWIGRSWSMHPTLGSSKTLHGLCLVAWTEHTKVGQWSRWNPERKLWMHSAFQGLLVDCYMCGLYNRHSHLFMWHSTLISSNGRDPTWRGRTLSFIYIYIKLSFRLRHVIYVAYTIDSHLFMWHWTLISIIIYNMTQSETQFLYIHIIYISVCVGGLSAQK